MEPLKLSSCGCKLPEFVCVVCKHKCVVERENFTDPRYSPWHHHRYYKFVPCTSTINEDRLECPKVVICGSGGSQNNGTEGVICGGCKLGSIVELYLETIDPSLQVLLELSLSLKN